MNDPQQQFSRWREFFFPVAKIPWLYAKHAWFGLFIAIESWLAVLLLKQIVQWIESWNYQLFVHAIVILATMKVVGMVMRRRHRQYDRKALTWSRRHIYKKYFPEFIRFDSNETETLGTGRIQSIIIKWIDIRGDYLYESMMMIPRVLWVTIFSLALIASLSWELFWYSLLVIALVTLWVAIRQPEERKRRKVAKDIMVEKSRHDVRQVMSKFEILSHNKVAYEMKTIKEFLDKFIVAKLFQGKRNYVTYELFPMMIELGRVVILFFTWLFVFRETASIAEFVMVSSAMGMLMNVVRNALWRVKWLTRNIVHIEKLRDTYQEIPRMQWYDRWHIFQYQTGHVTISNMTFWYKRDKLFKNFSLEIQWWKKTALVWPSGSGKSTLLKLIAGYLHVDSGAVSVDGQALPGKTANKKSVALQSYYTHIGYLSQEPIVFDGTIRENLLYGVETQELLPPTPSVSEGELKDKISRVLSLACCEFVYDLPDGVDTSIGERGIKLSWWQKQRLAIAKLMMKQPEIILLDEPTAALDSVSEKEVTDALHNLFEWRTVIIVAHRLQTVKEADEIIVLDQWALVERGTHKQLKHLKGNYAQLLDLQGWF